MNAMGHTIAGAASGETVEIAAPKGSQSQAKGQKSNDIICYSGLNILFVILMTRLEIFQSLFLLSILTINVHKRGHNSYTEVNNLTR